MLKLSQENQIIDLPDLNGFQIGDEVIVDANADYDRFEGVIIGIELRRLHGSSYLVPSITILHDGCITEEFKPIDCRKAHPQPPAPSSMRIEDEIASVVQSVNEWDDRTSPDEYPEHLLITSEELTLILRNFAATVAAIPTEKE